MCEMGAIPLRNAEWLADAVAVLHGAYAHIHPYMAVVLCLAGARVLNCDGLPSSWKTLDSRTAMNAVTVVVLTRPSMLSPINAILCAVAICDILVMTSVLVFVYHFLISASFRCDPDDYDRMWAYFLFAHSQSTVILHATSIWLTVLLAQIRVYTIRRATTGPSEAITARATGGIALVTLCVVALVNIPNFMTFEVRFYHLLRALNYGTFYDQGAPARHTARVAPDECWCTPSIVEIDAELWLSCLNTPADDMREAVPNFAFNTTLAVSSRKIFHVRASDEDCELLKVAFWTNGILFKVVPCTLLTVSIIALLKIIKDVSVRRKSLAQIYLPLGDLMDLLSLLNSAVNFLIYCAMSRKFRSVFIQTFLACLPDPLYRKFLQDWPALAEMELSRHKPSGFTDLTKTEQLALTSHRVSATSMLIHAASKESTSKMYTGNLLSVGERVFKLI
ncbi:hypothetical protein ANCDUO_00443 [Ancylostoma duodenale]|uniref:G-protein coupled receptors family 1 profile domain-containing protein n=1 Tax=Ancylostoma duodenale TaxID=51022 RepID=A0A0C2HC27_9BILA|nr:hypothetical protein ANCDUO_00443 [Ancylostoma duodenale]